MNLSTISKNPAQLIATFRKRVTIQSSSRVSDGQGGFVETWNSGSTVWASIEPKPGNEVFQASQTMALTTHRIMMRYTSEVTDASRIIYGTRVFYVKDVIDVEERGRFLLIKAIERGSIPANAYTAEDGTTPYTAEDGSTVYVAET